MAHDATPFAEPDADSHVLELPLGPTGPGRTDEVRPGADLAGHTDGGAGDDTDDDGVDGLGEDYLFPTSQVTSIRIPKMEAVSKLSVTLRNNGLPDAVADAVARSVVDPSEVRKRIVAANVQRVPGAVLLTVETTLFTHAVVPYLANPRASGGWRFPVSGDKVSRPLCEVTAVGNLPELLISADGPEHVSATLGANASALRTLNNYRESVGDLGVLRPVTAAPLTIQHRDGTAAVTVLTTVDGSSRLTACQELLGLKAHEAVYPLAQAPKKLRAEIGKVIDLAGSDPTPEQRCALRALTVPATVIVGFTPVADGVDFSSAIRSLLGLIHVDPPKDWGPGGTLDAQADSVLDTLVEDGILDEAQCRWMAGMMDPSDGSRAGFTTLQDERFAQIMRTLMHPSARHGVITGIRRLTASRTSPDKKKRLSVAAELGLRSVRHRLGPDRVAAARSGLVRAMEAHGLFPQTKPKPGETVTWYSVTRRSPEAIRDAALAELDAGVGYDSRNELAVLGAWWLAQEGVLVRQRRGLEPNVALSTMLGMRQGIHLLYQAVVDGRAGRPLSSVDGEGNVVQSTSGAAQVLDAARLQGMLPSGDVTEDIGAAAEAASGAQPPQERLHQGFVRLHDHTNVLHRTMESLKALTDEDGRSVVAEVGVDEELAEVVGTLLAELRDDVKFYARVRAAHVAAHRAELEAFGTDQGAEDDEP